MSHDPDAFDPAEVRQVIKAIRVLLKERNVAPINACAAMVSLTITIQQNDDVSREAAMHLYLSCWNGGEAFDIAWPKP
jgi:hypothetical protein